MPKNPNGRPVKRDEPMNGAMKFFLAGCAAELYLLLIRRYYLKGNIDQVLAWNERLLPAFAAVGAVAAVIGAACAYAWRGDRKRRGLGAAVLGAGAFLALASLLVLWKMTIVPLLMVVVLVVMLLAILWSLYDQECALALTVLGFALVVLWVCRRVGDSLYLGGYVKAAAVVYLLLSAAVALAVKTARLPDRVFSAKADPLPVYAACALSAVAMVASLAGRTAATYAMWALAIVVFALAVYYTVKQL